MMSFKFENITQIALLFATVVALSGCSQSRGMAGSPTAFPTSPADKFPIQVVAEKDELTLVVAPHVFTLSKANKDSVARLAESWKHVGHGDIWVVAPVGSANAAASIGAAAQIAKIMVDQGIRPTSIKMNSYLADETDETAPITVMFKRYAAYTRKCGLWAENVAVTPANQSSMNVGCSTQANLAALIEDPRDLVEPASIDSADAARRVDVLQKYRAGSATASKRGAGESGTVSKLN